MRKSPTALTDAEVATLRKQINSPLLDRMLKTIEVKDRLLSEKDEQIARLSTSGRVATHRQVP